MGQSPPSTPGAGPEGAVEVVPAAERIAASALRLLGARRARLAWRLEPDPAPITWVTAPAEDHPPSAPGGPLAVEIAFGERALRERRALCTPDVLSERQLAVDPPAREAIAREGLGALAAAPVLTLGAAAGSLVLADRTGRRFTEQEMVLLATLAGQMALVLENARLQATLARQRHESEEVARVAHLVSEQLDVATTGQRIADSVLGLLGVHSSAIRLRRADGRLGAIALGGRARAYAAPGDIVPAGIGLVGRAFVEGHPMWTDDIRTDDRFALTPEIRERNAAVGIVAGLAAPLRVAGEVIGVLSVGSPAPRIFTESEVALLQTFADQAAIALSNAQAQEAVAQQAERLRILHEIDRAIITETAPVAIAEAVLGRLRDLLEVPRAIVNLFDWEAGEVEWLAAVGRHRMHLGPGVRYPLHFAGDLDALRRGEPQVVDVRTLPPSPEGDALLASGVLVYMVVPMIVGDQVIGSVSFGGEQAEFPDEQVSIAREVATQLAIAIVQARLLEQVRRHAAELEGRVEERTRELEGANRELEAFTHTVSHDLKAPLRGMAGFAQALEEDYAARLDESGRQFLSRIRAASERMADLIDDLLQYSRIRQRAIERRPVALRPLLDPLLEDLAGEIAARGLTVTLDLAVADIMSERQGLQEALANLLSNAVKFSPRQGGTIAVRSYREADQVVVAVADRGVGFDMQYHDRIFGIFERLHRQEDYPGTGVGLAIVRKVAERHGGRAWAESAPGQGSTFFLALPDPR
ncbi:MAG TPA: GAF domain-containing protein [Candidatus Deferrimicrobiaceae bacterium]|nr:GAF domain-containing protein [Candidatus Deferrimicrobiaceae bacterium]